MGNEPLVREVREQMEALVEGTAGDGYPFTVLLAQVSWWQGLHSLTLKCGGRERQWLQIRLPCSWGQRVLCPGCNCCP